MKVYIHLFGAARERIGRNVLEVDVREPATIADVAAQVLLHHTQLGELLETAASPWTTNSRAWRRR